MPVISKVILYALLFSMSSCSRQVLYIDSNPPGNIPKIFAPSIISKSNQAEFGSVFSNNGKEFYFAVEINRKAEIRYSKLHKGKWTKPKTILSHPIYSFNDPFLSPDESKLYYISDMPRDKTDTIKDIDIWYSTVENITWSQHINAGPRINSDKNEYYISFTDSGTMYFASNRLASEKRAHDFDIFSSKNIKGVFQEAIPLRKPINTGRYEADVFIAPDESYIIFCSAKKDGFGKGDLHISFKNTDGTWTIPKNMGATFNSESNEMCPFVTRDGKYFFYTSKQDIYWVSTGIFESFE